jgi:predicted kinase
VLEGRFIATALTALRLGCNVVLDFGVWARDERTALRWLASTVGAEAELVYVAIDPADQRRRVEQRFATAPESTFPMTQADLDHWRTVFQPPDDTELSGNDLDPPPAEFDGWHDWVTEWWPTALPARRRFS